MAPGRAAPIKPGTAACLRRFPAAPLHRLPDEPDSRGQAFWVTTSDGLRLRLGLWQPAGTARGTVLLFQGRTEYLEKYSPIAAWLAAQGLAVIAPDWRGQGLSDRLLADPRPGHIGDFADYRADVAAVVSAAESLALPRPWQLLAHSMGGCIGLAALRRPLRGGVGRNRSDHPADVLYRRLPPARRPGSKHHCRCPRTGTPPACGSISPLASIGNFPPTSVTPRSLPPAAGVAGGRFWGSLRAKQDGTREHFRWVQ